MQIVFQCTPASMLSITGVTNSVKVDGLLYFLRKIPHFWKSVHREEPHKRTLFLTFDALCQYLFYSHTIQTLAQMPIYRVLYGLSSDEKS